MSEAEQELREFEMARNAAELLHKTYPGHLWTAEVSGGTLTIRNLSLHGQWGFVLHPRKHLNLDLSIRHAGGELLERWNISRGKAGAEQASQYRSEHGWDRRIPGWVF